MSDDFSILLIPYTMQSVISDFLPSTWQEVEGLTFLQNITSLLFFYLIYQPNKLPLQYWVNHL